MTESMLSLVPPGSILVDKVWDLYRKNSNTLGFLPRGALDEFVHAGCVLAHTRNEELLGYAAWRRSRGEVVLVHLCVAEEHRGSDCSENLLRHLIHLSKDANAIRLRCRKDYEAANQLWPKHGFALDNEIVGRGADSMPLFEWRRVNRDDAPLLRAIRDAPGAPSRLIAIDANVFFDIMDPAAPHYEESGGLLSDWLDDVEICVTRELRNEVSRQPDPAKRQRALSYFHRFEELAGHPDKLDEMLDEIGDVMPTPVTHSDFSDRRQLAHASLDGAKYFATRDEVLLDHADDILTVTGLTVLRPCDMVARLQGNFLGQTYAPVRLNGTRVERRSIVTEHDLLPFQRFSSGETKATWLRMIRTTLSSCSRCTVQLIGVRGEHPRVALAVDQSPPSSLRLRFLRTLSGPLTGTLLRRALADVIEIANRQGLTSVMIDDPGSGDIQEALLELGFQYSRDGILVFQTLREMVDVTGAIDLINDHFPDVSTLAALEPRELEAMFWPLKVLGAGISTYIVPIQKYWATALFDRDLAENDFFDVPEHPALALENVYYSRSNVVIPEGSRILWYVSSPVSEVRAVSLCLGTETDEATRLSRKFHRLGAYTWQNILDAAGGDPSAKLKAYHFAKTELLVCPLPWKRLENLILDHMGTKNRVPGPLRVPEGLFTEVYQEGMRMLA
ncbi:MAG: GNAT family N-acetyltransferase [Gammaproteobacteria bacterium]|nr:GNAT family N-acetyltransferase [Gammaproteobacteria bacterium]MCP5135378.1 GNAT family N-acetyltransferase [Gammaproteobacteria bacterium]